MIQSFSFGTMTIDGVHYTSDLMIFPDGRVQDGWWRPSGHRLTFDDLGPLVDAGPRWLIAGTGINGRMRPDDDLLSVLSTKGVTFVAAANADAVQQFNAAVKTGKPVAGCFHLTC